MKKYIVSYTSLPDKEKNIVGGVLCIVAGVMPCVNLLFNIDPFLKEMSMSIGCSAMGLLAWIALDILAAITVHNFVKKVARGGFLLVFVLFCTSSFAPLAKGFTLVDNSPFNTLLWVLAASFSVWSLTVWVSVIKNAVFPTLYHPELN